MKPWIVEVYGYMPELFMAATKDKARYRAFLAFREAIGSRISFRDFIARGVRIRPARDGEIVLHQ